MGISRGRPFEAGNKFGKGRPEGSRNKATLALQELLTSNGRFIVGKTIMMAAEGDTTALRLCVERIVPVRKGRPVQFKLPVINTVVDMVKAQKSVLKQVAAAVLTPEEGQLISGLIQNIGQSLMTLDLVPRIEKLEQAKASTPVPEAEPQVVDPPAEGEPPDREAELDLAA